VTLAPDLAALDVFAGLHEAALVAAADGLRSNRVGAVRESVTIALGRLVEAGEIEVRNRTLTSAPPISPPARAVGGPRPSRLVAPGGDSGHEMG